MKQHTALALLLLALLLVSCGSVGTSEPSGSGGSGGSGASAPCLGQVLVQCPAGLSPTIPNAPDAGAVTCSARGGGQFCCSSSVPCAP